MNQKIHFILQTCTILSPQFVCFRDQFGNGLKSRAIEWTQNETNVFSLN